MNSNLKTHPPNHGGSLVQHDLVGHLERRDNDDEGVAA